MNIRRHIPCHRHRPARHAHARDVSQSQSTRGSPVYKRAGRSPSDRHRWSRVSLLTGNQCRRPTQQSVTQSTLVPSRQRRKWLNQTANLINSMQKQLGMDEYFSADNGPKYLVYNIWPKGEFCYSKVKEIGIKARKVIPSCVKYRITYNMKKTRHVQVTSKHSNLMIMSS